MKADGINNVQIENEQNEQDCLLVLGITTREFCHRQLLPVTPFDPP